MNFRGALKPLSRCIQKLRFSFASSVHIVRNSLRFVPWKDKKEVVADLKTIYTAINAEEAKKNLNAFHTK
ncbi:MAG: transposase [Nitrospinaceae bacterium]